MPIQNIKNINTNDLNPSFQGLERRQNPETHIQLQKFRNSKSHNAVNCKLANA